MTVLFKNGQRKYKLDSGALKNRTQTVLDALDRPDSEVSLWIVSDARIKQLNRQYRGVPAATDVLAFPQDTGEPSELSFDLMGDVVVSAETAARQAREHHLAFEEELILLIIHGILHLLGMDHERSPREARQMRQKTGRLFQKIFPGRRAAGSSNF